MINEDYLNGFIRYSRVVENAFDFYKNKLYSQIKAGSVAVSKPTGFADIREIDNIIETNHSNQTFVIKLNFAGDEGISGFYNNYKYLADNLIDSIKFLK